MLRAIVLNEDAEEQVAAQDLLEWSDADVSATDFGCVGCGSRVTPCAVGLEYKVQAHFRIAQGEEHDDGCELVRRSGADTGSGVLGESRGSTAAPHRLVLGFDDVDTNNEASGGDAHARPSGGRSPGRTRATSRGRTSLVTRSLQSIAVAHCEMKSKDERAQTPLEIPGVEADNYLHAFRQLTRGQISELKHARVFYGDLRFNSDPIETDSQFVLEYFVGEDYDASLQRFARPWLAVVDHQGWTSAQRNRFKARFQAAINEARAARDKSMRVRTRLYVLAEQDPDQPDRLLVSDRARLALVVRAVDS